MSAGLPCNPSRPMPWASAKRPDRVKHLQSTVESAEEFVSTAASIALESLGSSEAPPPPAAIPTEDRASVSRTRADVNGCHDGPSRAFHRDCHLSVCQIRKALTCNPIWLHNVNLFSKGFRARGITTRQSDSSNGIGREGNIETGLLSTAVIKYWKCWFCVVDVKSNGKVRRSFWRTPNL